MSFSMRRLTITTERIDPPIRNMQWRAKLGGIAAYNDPHGLGATEPDAVRDLYEEIAFREQQAAEDQQQEAGE